MYFRSTSVRLTACHFFYSGKLAIISLSACVHLLPPPHMSEIYSGKKNRKIIFPIDKGQTFFALLTHPSNIPDWYWENPGPVSGRKISFFWALYIYTIKNNEKCKTDERKGEARCWCWSFIKMIWCMTMNGVISANFVHYNAMRKYTNLTFLFEMA